MIGKPAAGREAVVEREVHFQVVDTVPCKGIGERNGMQTSRRYRLVCLVDDGPTAVVEVRAGVFALGRMPQTDGKVVHRLAGNAVLAVAGPLHSLDPRRIPADLLLLPEGLLPRLLPRPAGLRRQRAAQVVLGRELAAADPAEPAPLHALPGDPVHRVPRP